MIGRIFIPLLLTWAFVPIEAKTYYSCDFNSGIPTEFTVIDNDGLAPSSSSKRQGFSQGDAWIAMALTATGDVVAASHSWYAEAGRSDDWLITPAIRLEPGDAELVWRAMSADDTSRDGYKVLVSPSGSESMEDFTHCLYSTDGEMPEWTFHSADLSVYAGSEIRLAFVNDSYDCCRLYIDDIVVATPAYVYANIFLEDHTWKSGLANVTGEVFSPGNDDVDNVEIVFSSNGKETSETIASLQPGEKQEFTLYDAIDVEANGTTPYSITVKSAGRQFDIEGAVTSFPRRALVEELTGTWCAWCVRGIVAIDLLEETRPDDIVIITVHSDDVMDIGDYAPYLSSVVSSPWLPYALFNRNFGADPNPASISGYVDRALSNEQVTVGIEASASADSLNNTITASACFRFAEPTKGDDYRIAMCLVEDRVHHPGDNDYRQNNTAYSGGSNGAMGGWEDKDARVSPDEMWYENVSRGFMGNSAAGLTGLLPETMDADTPVTVDLAMEFPENVDVFSHCHIVVMLIHDATDRVVNAVEAVLFDNTTGLEGTRIVHDGTQPSYYSIDGIRRDSPSKGINIVRYPDGSTKKILMH